MLVGRRRNFAEANRTEIGRSRQPPRYGILFGEVLLRPQSEAMSKARKEGSSAARRATTRASVCRPAPTALRVPSATAEFTGRGAHLRGHGCRSGHPIVARLPRRPTKYLPLTTLCRGSRNPRQAKDRAYSLDIRSLDAQTLERLVAVGTRCRRTRAAQLLNFVMSRRTLRCESAIARPCKVLDPCHQQASGDLRRCLFAGQTA